MLDPAEALEVLDRLLDADLGSRTDGQLADDLRAMQLMRNRLDGEIARRLGVFDARGGAGSEHALSTQSWVRHNCLVSAATAAGRVALARRLRTESPLQRGLRSGSLSYEHAVVITRTLDKLPEASVAPAEQILVATAHTIDPGQLRRVAATIREAVAPDVLVEESADVRERRFLDVSETLDGMVSVDGLLDPEGGALLLAAVRSLATPAGPDDHRSATQRRADGLIEVVRLGLDTGELPASGGEKPHLALTIDYGRMLEGKMPAAYTTTGSVIVGETVRRILCDAQVSRIVTLGPSEVLDVGRATRTIPPAIARALRIRDGGCVGHGCERPPAWTEAHHVIHWVDGGATSVDNLALLCARHHHLVHEEGWVLIRHGAGWIAVPPHLAQAYDESTSSGNRLPVLPSPALLQPPRQRTPSRFCDP